VTSIHLDPQSMVEILTDPDTSLLQRDFFLLRLEEEFKKSWRYGWGYALIVFDVEELADVKAKDGERAWSAVLLSIAGEILSASRDIDLSTRFEDGRFMVLLPGCDGAGARAFVDRVLRGQVKDCLDERFHVTVGGTITPQPGLDQMDELMSRAETALVAAREGGGEELVLWSESLG
jgi:diguanylate cyclase (GGDEF)-like protein